MNGFRQLDYDEVQRAITCSSPASSVYVGCDSRLDGTTTLFGVVVVVHIETCKGCMVFGRRFSVGRRMAISERLMKEVESVMECAFAIQPSVGSRNFEVHLDLNPDPAYKSSAVLRQAVSYVKAQGFPYQVKPAAWAASTAADYLIG